NLTCLPSGIVACRIASLLTHRTPPFSAARTNQLSGGHDLAYVNSGLLCPQSGIHYYVVAAPGLTRQGKALGPIQRIERVLRSHYHSPRQQPGLALTAHAGAAIVGKLYPKRFRKF